MKREIPELEMMDKVIGELTQDLVVPPGSIFRVACQYLENWGVERTAENTEWIKKRSRESYMEEYGDTGAEINTAIKRAIIATGLGSGGRDEGDATLNRNVAGMAVNNLMALNDGERRFRIADLGAGEGATTVAILDRLNRTEESREFASLCEFYLVEPSFKRIKSAVEEKLDKHPIKIDYSIITATHEDLIPMVKEGTFDMVVSSSVYHHMTFPDYLDDLYDVLTDEGVLIIGDWYYNILEHPARIIPLLEGQGLARDRIDRFRNYFDIPFDTREIDKNLTPEQERTNRKFVKFINALAVELSKIGARQYFLEGYELLSERMEKMKQAGFETDIKELREKHRAFSRTLDNVRRIYPGTEIACVISAGKKQFEEKKLGKLRR